MNASLDFSRQHSSYMVSRSNSGVILAIMRHQPIRVCSTCQPGSSRIIMYVPTLFLFSHLTYRRSTGIRNGTVSAASFILSTYPFKPSFSRLHMKYFKPPLILLATSLVMNSTNGSISPCTTRLVVIHQTSQTR